MIPELTDGTDKLEAFLLTSLSLVHLVQKEDRMANTCLVVVEANLTVMRILTSMTFHDP